MAVPKKRISISNISKKRIRKNLWKGKGILGGVKSFFFNEISFYW
uniref:Ribosomal protein L32 n=1 Tax=Byrsonima coccolobifolia TaxID=1027102 RepID=A0A2L1IP53_9ROSI|nr:ribosomal protein L32 [Byrsonima coccolobifolia]AVD96526.1 ribosomal protein L32 [Byrsonima coccolobifolia]